MLRRVKRQAEDCRWQPGPSELPLVEQRLSGSGGQLSQRAVDDRVDVTDDCRQRHRRITGGTFFSQRSPLHIGQRLTARVGEETIERAARVTDVKPD